MNYVISDFIKQGLVTQYACGSLSLLQRLSQEYILFMGSGVRNSHYSRQLARGYVHCFDFWFIKCKGQLWGF